MVWAVVFCCSYQHFVMQMVYFSPMMLLLSWDVLGINELCVSSPPLWPVSQANLDESQMSSSPFLRALMTAVCKAAVKGKYPTTCRTLSSVFAQMAPLIAIFTLCQTRSSAARRVLTLPSALLQMITPTVEWTRPSSRGDCLYYSSTLTQTLSDSCKHFMHFRRWSSPSISLQVSSAT